MTNEFRVYCDLWQVQRSKHTEGITNVPMCFEKIRQHQRFESANPSHPRPNLQVSPSPSLLASQSPSLQVSPSPNLQVSKSPHLLVPKSPSLLVPKSPHLLISLKPTIHSSLQKPFNIVNYIRFLC